MTLQAIRGVLYPHPQCGFTMHQVAAPIFSGITIDASAEKVAFVFRVPKTGTLKTVGFRLGTVVQNTNALRVSFQNVDLTTGDPDGTQDQFRDVTVIATDDDAWKQTGIVSSDGTDGGVKRSVTKGDLLSIVIEFSSFAASDSLNIAVNPTNTRAALMMECYVDHFTAAWATNSGVMPLFALEYDDGSYITIDGGEVIPIATVAQEAISSSTTPDEVALYFQVPFSCKVRGAWVSVDLDAGVEVILYDSDGSTAMAGGAVTLDSDVRVATTPGVFYVEFTSEATLLVNTNYRLAVKPTTVTSVNIVALTVNAAAIFDQMEGGQVMHWSERTDAGAWSQTTTKRLLAGLCISALDDGAGGGGGGGMRLAGAGGLAA